MRLGFFFREATRALRRNVVPSFAAVATVIVTVLVLGVFIPVVQATTGAADTVRSRVIADVFLKPDATKKDEARVRHLLEKDTPHVKSVEFVSKEKAIKEESKRFPDAYKILGKNPLPGTFRITPDNPENISKIRNALAPETPSGGHTVIDPAIDEVSDRKEDAGKILSVTEAVKLTMGFLTALLVLASVLLIANTISLSLYARRREVEVMKLVGATDWFIRWPFVIEGVMVGAIGGVIAIAVLIIMKISFVDPLSSQLALISGPETMSFALLIVVLLGSAIAVSAIGSGLSLRRFLRI